MGKLSCSCKPTFGQEFPSDFTRSVIRGHSIGDIISLQYKIDAKNFWTDGTNTYYSNGSDQYVIGKGGKRELKTWNGLTRFSGRYVWSDNKNIYYSYNNENYILNGDTWEATTFTGPIFMDAENVWTDGINIRYTCGEDNYIFKNGHWEEWEWDGDSSRYIEGRNIWTNGTNIYYSHGTDHYVLHGNTWYIQMWYGIGYFFGQYVWSDGTNTYYSGETEYSGNYDNYSKQYVLQGITWVETKHFAGYDSYIDGGTYINGYINGYNTWTDGTNTYFSESSKQYVFDGSRWIQKKWKGYQVPYGANIWSDGTNIYYSNGSSQYILNGDTWTEKTWNGLTTTTFNGRYVWSDGTNIYYSNNDDQYILNGDTWTEKDWGDNIPKSGNYVWTDGSHIYYSQNTSINGNPIHYIFEDGVWKVKTWNGLTVFNGQYVWSDGTNMYCSNDNGSQQYILNGNTWESKAWDELTNIDGRFIWNHDGNTYYTVGYANEFMLINGKWEGFPHRYEVTFEGGSIWSDGVNIYYSNYDSQYVLVDGIWEPKWWGDFKPIPSRRSRIWTDGTNMYYSESINNEQYVLIDGIWEEKTWNIDDIDGIYIWYDGTNARYTCGTTQYILDNGVWKEDVLNVPYTPDPEYLWSDGNNIYLSNGSRQMVLEDTIWTPKNWIDNWSGESIGLVGMDIWTDGVDIIHTYDYNSHILKDNGNWEIISFINNNVQYGRYVWTDGTNIYGSSGSYYSSYGNFTHYLLSTMADGYPYRWEQVTFDGLPVSDTRPAEQVWTDGLNIYISYLPKNQQYILLPTTASIYSRTVDDRWIKVANVGS